MKTIVIFLLSSIAILLIIIFLGATELAKENRLLQSELEGRKKANRIERDSLENSLKLTRDSLEIAFATIRLSHEETQKANAASQREIRTLKSILFVRFENDSLRMNELKRLYPSWR